MVCRRAVVKFFPRGAQTLHKEINIAKSNILSTYVHIPRHLIFSWFGETQHLPVSAQLPRDCVSPKWWTFVA